MCVYQCITAGVAQIFPEKDSVGSLVHRAANNQEAGLQLKAISTYILHIYNHACTNIGWTYFALDFRKKFELEIVQSVNNSRLEITINLKYLVTRFKKETKPESHVLIMIWKSFLKNSAY